jgi:DinB superfamily
MLDLQYPIGKFKAQEVYSAVEITENISRIANLPALLQTATHVLTDTQLDTPYRDGGWSVRQVIHHLADSHMNAYIRLKWTLTETSPLIKAYEEKEWAVTPETKENPEISLNLLISLHRKWALLLQKLSADEMQKHFVHPQTKKEVKLVTQLAMYAWHGEHHLAHITQLKERMGW